MCAFCSTSSTHTSTRSGRNGRRDWLAVGCWQTNKQRFIIQQIAPLKAHLRKGCKTSMFNFHVVYTEHAQESVASAPSQLECQQCNEQCHNIDWSDPEHEVRMGGRGSLGFCSLDLDILNDGYVEWWFPDTCSISQSRDFNMWRDKTRDSTDSTNEDSSLGAGFVQRNRGCPKWWPVMIRILIGCATSSDKHSSLRRDMSTHSFQECWVFVRYKSASTLWLFNISIENSP